MDRRGKIQLGQFCWHARNQYLLFCSVKYLLLGFRLDLPNLNSIRRLRFFFVILATCAHALEPRERFSISFGNSSAFLDLSIFMKVDKLRGLATRFPCVDSSRNGPSDDGCFAIEAGRKMSLMMMMGPSQYRWALRQVNIQVIRCATQIVVLFLQQPVNACCCIAT